MDTPRLNSPGSRACNSCKQSLRARPATRVVKTLDLHPVSAEEGFVVFEGSLTQAVYNPLGSVHGGYAATLLDTVMGCAVHSCLQAGQGYTTLELKIAYHRALTDSSGPVRAEGRVISFGRRAAFAEGKLSDKGGNLCATATMSAMGLGCVKTRRRAIAIEQTFRQSRAFNAPKL